MTQSVPNGSDPDTVLMVEKAIRDTKSYPTKKEESRHRRVFIDTFTYTGIGEESD